MAKQQPEGVYLYIDDSGSRFIAVVDAFGVANMLPWKQPGEIAASRKKAGRPGNLYGLRSLTEDFGIKKQSAEIK